MQYSAGPKPLASSPGGGCRRRPPLNAVLSEEAQERLPAIFGGVSVALAKTLTILDPSARRIPLAERDRAFRIFDLLI